MSSHEGIGWGIVPYEERKMECPVCKGKGSHVNPAIDGNGLSAEMREDPEFMEEYMDGAYDVVCNNCGGQGTIEETVPGENAEKLEQAADDRRLAALEDGDYEAYQSAHDVRWPI